MFSPRDSQNLLDILNQMPDGALELAPDGTLLHWNRRAIEVLYGSDFEQGQLDWFELLHVEDLDHAHALWAKAMETPGQWHTIQTRVTPSLEAQTGHVYEWRLCRLTPESDTLRCIVRDMEEPFEELAQRRDRMRLLYERTPIMAHAIDGQGKLVMVSDRWLEKLGYTREEVIGRPSTDFLSEKSKQFVALNFQTAFIQHGFVRDVPMEMVTKDGRTIHVEFSAVVERSKQGGISRCFAVIIDVSRRDALLAEVQHQSQELADQARMLESFFNAMPNGSAMTTTDRMIVRVNKALLEMFGYEEHELIGQNSAILYPDPESFERVDALITQFESQGAHEQINTQVHVRKNGELFLASVKGVPYLDEEGRILGVFGMIEDLTEMEMIRKRASNERELTDTFFEMVPSGAFIISLQGEVLRANEAAHTLFGYEPGKLVGVKTSTFHVHDHDAEHIKRTIMGGKSLQFECERTDGTTFPARLSGAPYHNEHGEHVGFVALLQDITEEVTRRMAIARNANLMNAFFEAIPYAAVIADPERRIIRANQAVTRIFDYTQSDVLGEKTDVFYNTQSSFEETGEAVFNRDVSRPRISTTVEFQRKNGVIFEGELIGAKIYDAASQVEGYLGLMRDMTDDIAQKKQLEEQNIRLKQANKDLERFAYIASHDLQEPLRKISSFLSLIEMDLEGKLGEDTARYFDFVRDGADRLKNLIRDLLAYSRADNLPELEPCLPMEVFKQSVSEYQPMLDKQGAGIDIDDRSECAKVMSHEAVLSQVYSNLLSNAIKYAHPDRPLQIRVSCSLDSPTHLRFTVEDNGLGIPEKHQTRIFEIFQRLHRQDEIKGQGIGLAICKKIVERQGGEFGVESDGSSGSTFWFTLRRAT